MKPQTQTPKPKREKLPVQTVLEWLQEHYPQLHEVAELDRNWVWLPVDLRGDEWKEVREALKEFGFRFAKRGHVLPSGNTGTWAHSCDKPIAFKRKGNGNKSKRKNESESDDDTQRADPLDNSRANLPAEVLDAF
jgi:hypothetical protein